MNRKQRHTIPCAAAATLALLAGCTASRQVDTAVTVTPSPVVLTSDRSGQAQMDVCFHIPSQTLSRRSRLVILPQLVVGDSVAEEYLPLVVDAPIYSKKKQRREVLEGYNDPYADRAVAMNRTADTLALPYRQCVSLPEGVDSASIMGVVTTDGCGACTAIDTVALATVSRPVPVVEEIPLPDLVWMEPTFVVRPKVMEGKGEANLQFAINKHDIDLAMGHNRQELEHLVQTLAPVLSDTLATPTMFRVYGMASADGPLAFNTALARRRAEAAATWMADQLALRPEVRRLITVGSRPEGWQPVLAAMAADGHRDTVAVQAILEKYADSNDDVQERYIRRLPCWNEIRDKYLQKNRKVEVVYRYTLRSFTDDAELLEMYRTRPDAFNESELLRVAALMDSDAEKKAVYAAVLARFPQSQVAANNLAFLWLKEGNRRKAREVLDRLQHPSVPSADDRKGGGR